MDQGKICGIAVGLLGGWLLFGAWEAVLIGIRDNHSWTMIFDAAFTLEFMASLTAFVAGIAALTELKGGAWFAGISTFLMGVLVIAMIFTGVEKTLWQNQIIYLFILTALFLGILVARGQNQTSSDGVARELAEIAKEEEKKRPRQLDDT